MGNDTEMASTGTRLVAHAACCRFADLEAKLRESQRCRRRLVATDGVFSMDGNVAPLRYVCSSVCTARPLLLCNCRRLAASRRRRVSRRPAWRRRAGVGNLGDTVR